MLEQQPISAEVTDSAPTKTKSQTLLPEVSIMPGTARDMLSDDRDQKLIEDLRDWDRHRRIARHLLG